MAFRLLQQSIKEGIVLLCTGWTWVWALKEVSLLRHTFRVQRIFFLYSFIEPQDPSTEHCTLKYNILLYQAGNFSTLAHFQETRTTKLFTILSVPMIFLTGYSSPDMDERIKGFALWIIEYILSFYQQCHLCLLFSDIILKTWCFTWSWLRIFNHGIVKIRHPQTIHLFSTAGYHPPLRQRVKMGIDGCHVNFLHSDKSSEWYKDRVQRQCSQRSSIFRKGWFVVHWI